MGKRIWQYPEATGITNDDVILLDSPTGGSRSIKANKIGSVLINKTFTERGTFDAAEDNADGYKKVTVDVPYTDVLVASGPIASWDDGEDLPLKSLTANITPQQDLSHGNPSPSNICPISGWSAVDVNVSGKNLIDVDSITVTTNKLINAEGVETANDYWGTSSYYGIKPNTTYSLQARSDNVYTMYVVEYDINKNFIQRREVGSSSSGSLMKGSFTTSAECRIIRICLPKNGSSSTVQFNTVQLELGNTPSDFEPYNGQTYTIDLDGTRYGGTLDVVSGVLTVDRAYVDLGTLNYTYYSGNLFTTPISYLKPIPNERLCNALCSIYVAKKGIEYESIDGSFVAGFNNSRILAIHDSRFTDATAFKTAMNGVQLVYELATPQTYQLTPQQIKSLVGKNNIYSDTGDVDVEYQKIWVRPSA